MPFTPGRPLAEAKAELFKALAHPARIQVVELLAEREQTIGELAEGTGLELSHLSQQVSVLRRAGIVGSRRAGSNVICCLPHPQIAQLLTVARQVLTANLREGQALLKALDREGDDTAPTGAAPAAV